MHCQCSLSLLPSALLLVLALPPAVGQKFVADAGAAPSATAAAPLPAAATATEAASVPVTTVPAAPKPEILPPPSEALGDTLNARGRYLLAIRTYEALPPTAPILNKLGIACEHMLMFDRARSSFEAALKLDPRYAEVYNNLGTLAHSQGNLSRAEKMYRKALKLKSDSPATLKNLGTLYYAERKYKKGDAMYRHAVALDPEALERGNAHSVQAPTRQTVSEVHYHLAMTYAQAGSQKLALEYLRMAIGEGFHDRNRLLHDREFADLRTQPVFLRMVDDLKRD